MGNVLKFNLRYNPQRSAALAWLADNVDSFPECEQHHIRFHGWQFIRGNDGIMYFADCISRGISEEDFNNYIDLIS